MSKELGGRFKALHDMDTTIHVVYSPSNLLELHIFDELKHVWKVGKDEVQRVGSIQKLRSLEKTLFLTPMSGEKWLVDVDAGRLKKYLKDVVKLTEEGKETSVFLVRVENYGQFKELKSLLGDARGVNFLYLSWLHQVEVGYLVQREMNLRAAQRGEIYKEGMFLGEGVLSFIQRSYGNEPDKVMELCERVREGETFPDRKSVVTEVGVSSGSIDNMVFNLLKDPPKNVKLVVKNRMQVLNELVEVYGVRKTQNYLKASINRLKDLKILWMNGKLYNKVDRNSVPEPYSYEELRRYGKRLEDLQGIPLKRIIDLLKELGREMWVSKIDIQNFLYAYYSEVLV